MRTRDEVRGQGVLTNVCLVRRGFGWLLAIKGLLYLFNEKKGAYALSG